MVVWYVFCIVECILYWDNRIVGGSDVGYLMRGCRGYSRVEY